MLCHTRREGLSPSFLGGIMRKPAIPAITYMRGLCMLGVIGIHVGSYALANLTINIHLLGLLEIVSRFTVPAFFFLSAFGLFYHTLYGLFYIQPIMRC